MEKKYDEKREMKTRRTEGQSDIMNRQEKKDKRKKEA